jgi:hypothetical protein
MTRLNLDPRPEELNPGQPIGRATNRGTSSKTALIPGRPGQLKATGPSRGNLLPRASIAILWWNNNPTSFNIKTAT